MKVAIIIVNFNTKLLLQECLESMLKKKWKNDFLIYVVDNASSDGSVEMVEKEFPRVQLIKSDKNLGFTGGNNLALKMVDTDLVILLNSDTEVLENSLDNLVDFAMQNNYGIVSCKLLNKDKSLQPNAGELPFGMPFITWIAGFDDIPVFGKMLRSYHEQASRFYQKNRSVGWVSGSVMAIKKEVLAKIGFFDEGIFMYGEDVDYCLRAQRAGFKIGWTNEAEIIHLGGGSSTDPHLRQWIGEFKGLLYIYKKYYGLVASLVLKLVMYVFILIRMVAFLLIGKPKFSITYAKVFIAI